MLARDESDAVYQIARVMAFAGKPGPHRRLSIYVGAMLARDESDAVYQIARVMAFAGKPGPHRRLSTQ